MSNATTLMRQILILAPDNRLAISLKQAIEAEADSLYPYLLTTAHNSMESQWAYLEKPDLIVVTLESFQDPDSNVASLVTMAATQGTPLLIVHDAPDKSEDGYSEILQNLLSYPSVELLPPSLTPTLLLQQIATRLPLDAAFRSAASDPSPTVLVCDDDPDVMRILSLKLKRMGCRVLESTNGVEGLRVVRNERLDLILTDYNMPVMSGLEFLQLVRQEHPDLPVILMTAVGSEQVAAEGLKFGIKRYLVKPLNLKEVEQSVNEVLEQHFQQSLNRELTERLRATIRKLLHDTALQQLVDQVNQSLTSHLSLNHVLEKITTALATTFQARFAGIWLIPELADTPSFSANSGGMEADLLTALSHAQLILRSWAGVEYLQEQVKTFAVKDPAPLSSIVTAKRAQLITRETISAPLASSLAYTANEGEWLGGLKQEGFCGYPLFNGPRCCGVLAVFSTAEQLPNFPPVLQSLSHLLSVAIHDAQHFQEVERNLIERARVQEALKASEERYRRLVELSPEPIAVLSAGKCVYINQAGATLFGAARPEQLIGIPFWDAIHYDSRELASQLLERLEQERLTLPPSEIKFLSRDGQVIDIEVTAAPVMYQEQGAVQVLIRDITARKRAEENVHQQTTYLAALHNTTLALMNHLDVTEVLEGIVTHAATLLATQDGYIYLVDQVKGELVLQVGIGASRRYIGHRLKPGEGMGGKVWQTGQPMVIHDYHSWTEKSDQYSPNDPLHSMLGVPLISGSHVTGVIGLLFFEKNHTFGDEQVTLLQRFAQLAAIALDNARLFQKVEKERNTFKEVSEMKSEFVATVSHDLRSPLTSISGFTELLLTEKFGKLTPRQGDFLTRIKATSSGMLEIITDLLDLAQIESGLEERRDAVSLAGVIQAALNLVRSQAELKTITISEPEPETLAPIFIPGRPERLRQAVLNILSNAVKYTPAGGRVEIQAKVDQQAETCSVLLHISDTGLGIPAADLPFIFDKFYRVKTAETMKISGSGLGLAVVKSIVEQLHGAITVESELGKGSTFTFTLPCLKQSSAVSSSSERGDNILTPMDTCALKDSNNA